MKYSVLDTHRASKESHIVFEKIPGKLHWSTSLLFTTERWRQVAFIIVYHYCICRKVSHLWPMGSNGNHPCQQNKQVTNNNHATPCTSTEMQHFAVSWPRSGDRFLAATFVNTSRCATFVDGFTVQPSSRNVKVHQAFEKQNSVLPWCWNPFPGLFTDF
jgi:hypothetical protein